jgi:hypothetical protein
MYNNQIFSPDILDDTFSKFKVAMVMMNYINIVIIIVAILLFTNIGDRICNKIINILNKPIKFKKYEN